MITSRAVSALLGAAALTGFGCRQFSEPGEPEFLVDPASLAFTARAFGSSPPPQYLTISETGARAVRWTASTTASWLTLFSDGDTLPFFLWVGANTAGFGVGMLTDTIYVVRSSDGATRRVPVRLTMLPATPLTGRWAGVQDSVFLTLTVADAGGQVTGSGSLTPPQRPVWVTGTYAYPDVALTLAANGDTTTGTGSFVDDNTITLTLTGARVGTVSLTVYRQ